MKQITKRVTEEQWQKMDQKKWGILQGAMKSNGFKHLVYTPVLKHRWAF